MNELRSNMQEVVEMLLEVRDPHCDKLRMMSAFLSMNS